MPSETAAVPTALLKQREALKMVSTNQAPAPEPQASKAEAPKPPVEQPKPEQPVKTESVTSPAESSTRLAKTNTDREQEGKPEDFKHKYDVANGMLRKTSEENRVLKERLKELEEKAQANPAQQTEARSYDASSISDKEVINRVGEDLVEQDGIDYWRTQIAIAREEARSVLPINDNSDVAQIKAEFQKQKDEAFYAKLDGLIPEWEKINDTDSFQTFLGKLNETTGMTYNDLLNDAYDARDAGRVAAIFRDYAPSETPDGPFNNLVTPTSRPTEAPGTAGTITFEEYSRRMDRIPQMGLKPHEMEHEMKKLNAMMKEGKVTDLPAGL